VLTLQALTIGRPGRLPGDSAVLYLILGWWVVTLVAVGALVRVAPRRLVVGLVLGGTVAVHALALTSGPRLSDDLYRYAWDAKVQAAGIDPYRYPTNSPALAGLHDGWLWPDAAGCAAIHKGPGCSRINFVWAHTIYPPVAQVYFDAAHYLPGPPGAKKLQLYAAIMSMALTALLMSETARLGRSPGLAAAYAWSPLAGVDIGIDAHVDVVAALLSVAGLAVGARRAARSRRSPGPGDRPGPRPPGPDDPPREPGPSRRRAAVGGALLGAAVAVKLYPALLVPAAARRRRRGPTAVAAAVGVVGLSYLPHVLAVGAGTLGYLPRYLSSEGYEDGQRYFLLGLVGLSGAYARAVAVLLLAAVVAVAWRSDPDRVPPATAALWIVGAAFLLATPSQPWYGLQLVVLAVLSGRLEWLAVAAAPYVLYQSLFDHLVVPDHVARPGGYLVGAVVVGLAWIVRRARSPIPFIPASPRSATLTSRW
jgi:Glycosyltransferase family 87